MVTNLPQLRRTPGDGTLIAGRDRHQGREEDPELHLIMSDSIKELGQYYFLSLLRFRIFTHKKLSICLPRQEVYRKNIFVKLFWDSLAYCYIKYPKKNLLFIINLKHNYYLHKIFYFSKIQTQYYSQHFLFD